MTLITSLNWQEFFEDAPSVYVNGVLVQDAISADEAAGYCVVPERSDDGMMLVKGGELVMRKITGRVSIEGPRKIDGAA